MCPSPGRGGESHPKAPGGVGGLQAHQAIGESLLIGTELKAWCNFFTASASDRKAGHIYSILTPWDIETFFEINPIS